MKKIMFNDKYGLTKAVLEGRKTQTRRFIKLNANQYVRVVALDNGSFFSYVAVPGNKSAFMGEQELPEYDGQLSPAYFIGEEVAIAQSYHSAGIDDMAYDTQKANPSSICSDAHIRFDCTAGWSNKMFVKADLMPHRIKITDIRIERLQDISDADCLKEGFEYVNINNNWGNAASHWEYALTYEDKFGRYLDMRHPNHKEAYSFLIDKIYGAWTWNSNPWVFVYDFVLIK